MQLTEEQASKITRLMMVIRNRVFRDEREIEELAPYVDFVNEHYRYYKYCKKPSYDFTQCNELSWRDMLMKYCEEQL